jgi:GDP-L-fucose synthase
MWADTRVVVTGGRGFLGRVLVAQLRAKGASVTPVGRAEADLRDRGAALALFGELAPELVIHAAVEGGGIGWMRDHPVASGQDNVRINLNTLEAAQRCGATTFVGVSSACAYPRDCPVPFTEDHLWDGHPEPTNGPYALSKRLMMEMGRAHAQEHGLCVAFPVLANLYGPGDHVESTRAHVVADLVLRCLALERGEALVVWGTGHATREFLYVDDAAAGILACAAAPQPDPRNIGTGQEISIRSLAEQVVQACGGGHPIRFDGDKPDGQPRKCLSVAQTRAMLGWRAQVGLGEGLAKTVAWYRKQLGREG